MPLALRAARQQRRHRGDQGGAPFEEQRQEQQNQQWFETPRRGAHYDEYAHIVIDEAQDLSPMQWRMVGRRGKYASWTVVGDPAQAAWPDQAEASRAMTEAVGRRLTIEIVHGIRAIAGVSGVHLMGMGHDASTRRTDRGDGRSGRYDGDA